MPGNLHLSEYAVIMKTLAPSWHLIKISKCLQSPLSGFKTVELVSLSVDQNLWQVMCHTKSRKSFQYALYEKTTYMMAIAVLKSQAVCAQRQQDLTLLACQLFKGAMEIRGMERLGSTQAFLSHNQSRAAPLYRQSYNHSETNNQT